MKILIMVLSLMLIGFSCSNNAKNESDTKTEQDSENSKYQCPMKCEGEKTYAEPGKCPVCKMDLKKVNDGNDHEDHENH